MEVIPCCILAALRRLHDDFSLAISIEIVAKEGEPAAGQHVRSEVDAPHLGAVELIAVEYGRCRGLQIGPRIRRSPFQNDLLFAVAVHVVGRTIVWCVRNRRAVTPYHVGRMVQLDIMIERRITADTAL